VGVTRLADPKQHQGHPAINYAFPKLLLLRSIIVSISPIMAPTSTQDFDATVSVPASGGVMKLEAGIYVPTVAFFQEDEEVDTEITRKHALRLASSGIKGIGQNIGVHSTKQVLTLYSHTWQ
jgi:hypothetical protein